MQIHQTYYNYDNVVVIREFSVKSELTINLLHHIKESFINVLLTPRQRILSSCASWLRRED